MKSFQDLVREIQERLSPVASPELVSDVIEELLLRIPHTIANHGFVNLPHIGRLGAIPKGGVWDVSLTPGEELLGIMNAEKG
jgi:hypothetical protein